MADEGLAPKSQLSSALESLRAQQLADALSHVDLNPPGVEPGLVVHALGGGQPGEGNDDDDDEEDDDDEDEEGEGDQKHSAHHRNRSDGVVMQGAPRDVVGVGTRHRAGVVQLPAGGDVDIAAVPNHTRQRSAAQLVVNGRAKAVGWDSDNDEVLGEGGGYEDEDEEGEGEEDGAGEEDGEEAQGEEAEGDKGKGKGKLLLHARGKRRLKKGWVGALMSKSERLPHIPKPRSAHRRSSVGSDENMSRPLPRGPKHKFNLADRLLHVGSHPSPANSPRHDVKETTHADVIEDEAGRRLLNNYEVLQTIGRSLQAKVKLARRLGDGQLFAIKIMRKSMLARRRVSAMGASVLEEINTGIALMKKLDHPNLILLHEVINDPASDSLFLVLEYANKGTVFGDSGPRPLPLDVARKYLRDVVMGLEYLHLNRVIHRDLKPENLLVCESPDGTRTVKIGDFGLATFNSASFSDLTSSSGTPAFQSPELCSGEKVHGRSSDVWALGVTFYMFVFGTLPFWARNVMRLSEKIQHDEVKFPHEVDDSLKDLIERLLCKDQATRITLEEVKVHPWVTDGDKFPMPHLDPNEHSVVVNEEDKHGALQMVHRSLGMIKLQHGMNDLSHLGLSPRGAHSAASTPSSLSHSHHTTPSPYPMNASALSIHSSPNTARPSLGSARSCLSSRTDLSSTSSSGSEESVEAYT